MLYFLQQDGDGITREQIEAAGLGYAFEGGPASRGSDGPEGQRGKLLAAEGLYNQLRYRPDGQRWRRIGDVVPGHAASEVWVGVDVQLPTPADLARAEQLDGHPVRLGDGQEWLIPKARYWSEFDGRYGWQSALPAPVIGSNDDGFLFGPPPARFAELAEYTDAYVDESFALAESDSDDDPIEEGRPVCRDEQRMMRGVAAALGLNYRVTLAEVYLLGLIHRGTNMITQVHEAMADGPGLLRLQKKTLASGGSSS